MKHTDIINTAHYTNLAAWVFPLGPEMLLCGMWSHAPPPPLSSVLCKFPFSGLWGCWAWRDFVAAVVDTSERKWTRLSLPPASATERHPLVCEKSQGEMIEGKRNDFLGQTLNLTLVWGWLVNIRNKVCVYGCGPAGNLCGTLKSPGAHKSLLLVGS